MLDRFYPIVDSAAGSQRLAPLGVRADAAAHQGAARGLGRASRFSWRRRCVPRSHGAQLIVNDYWQLAIEAAATSCISDKTDLDGADLKALRSAGVRLGVSTHDDAELERALAAGAGLRRARADLPHDAQEDAMGAAGPAAHRGVEAAASASCRWSPSADSPLERLPAGVGRGRGRARRWSRHRASRRSGARARGEWMAAASKASMNDRYAAPVALPEVGAAGQQRLGDATVLVVGAGGLGCAVLPYLAAAGVGHLILSITTASRNPTCTGSRCFGWAMSGRLKVEAARDALLATNPQARIEVHRRAAHCRQRGRAHQRRGGRSSMRRTVFAVTYMLSDACERSGTAAGERVGARA